MIRAAASEDGARAGLQVRPGDRGPSALITAFRRELADLAGQIEGRDVTVDWPDGYTLDPSVEAACLGDMLRGAGPRSIACSFGGADREPFWPAPVQIDSTESTIQVGIDTEAGKPVEVLRAVERHVAPWAAEGARGKEVHVEFRGQGNVSRTMASRVREIFEQASVGRLETTQDGVTDVILPPLLAAATASEVEIALDVSTGSRTPEQVELALLREIEAAEWPANGTFRIQEPGDLADRLAGLLAQRGAARVIVGSNAPVQVHPSLFGPLGVDGQQLTLHACPSADAAVVAAQIDYEIPLLLAECGELASQDVVLAWHDGKKDEPLVQAALAAILATGPQRVLLAANGRARQIHPEVVLDFVSVLGRRDTDEAPMILLGIDVCPEGEDADAHRAKVIEKLNLLDLDGRRVLLIGRDEGQDLAIDPADGLFGPACTAAQQRAAAVLVFRGADRHGRPHFVVQDSKLEALPTGTRVGDPRPSARA